MDNVEQLRTVIHRIRSDSSQSTNPLTMKLNGTLDAAVNGGVSKFEVSNSLPSFLLLAGIPLPLPHSLPLPLPSAGILHYTLPGAEPDLPAPRLQTEVPHGRAGRLSWMHPMNSCLCLCMCVQ